MNESGFMAKMDEVLAFAKACHAESVELRTQVESLQAQVKKLNERLTYREEILVGWKKIGDRVGLDPETLRRLSQRNFDRLPVVKRHHVIVAHATALDAWLMRQQDFQRDGLSFDNDGNLVQDRRMKPRLVPRETGETPS